jgi:hypothetical protein
MGMFGGGNSGMFGGGHGGMFGGGQQGQQITPEEEEELLSQLGRAGLSSLAYIGESIDKPMAALRGLLAGRPEELANAIPFSDALGITSSDGWFHDSIGVTDDEDTVYGRDLLETWGIADENNDGLGGSDWDNIDYGDAAADVAGFAVDMLGVPMAGPVKALTKMGKLSQMAGITDEAARIAQLSGTGATKFRVTNTLDDAINRISDFRGPSDDFLPTPRVDPTLQPGTIEGLDKFSQIETGTLGLKSTMRVADEPLFNDIYMRRQNWNNGSTQVPDATVVASVEAAEEGQGAFRVLHDQLVGQNKPIVVENVVGEGFPAKLRGMGYKEIPGVDDILDAASHEAGYGSSFLYDVGTEAPARRAAAATTRDELMEKLYRAGEQQGMDRAAIDSMRGQQLGHTMSFGGMHLPKKLDEAVATGVDELSRSLGRTGMGRLAKQAFAPSVAGTKETVGQEWIGPLHNIHRDAGQDTARDVMGRLAATVERHADTLKRLGDGNQGNGFARAIETSDINELASWPTLEPGDFEKIEEVRWIKNYLDDMPKRAEDEGFEFAILDDVEGDYLPRGETGRQQNILESQAKQFNAVDPSSQIGREQFAKGWPGMTATLREISQQTAEQGPEEIAALAASKLQPKIDTFTQQLADLTTQRSALKDELKSFGAMEAAATREAGRPARELATLQARQQRWIEEMNGLQPANPLDTPMTSAQQAAPKQGNVTAYHGSAKSFDEFDADLMGSRDPGYFGEGFYFSDKKMGAQQYGDVAAGELDAGKVMTRDLDTSGYLKATPAELREKYGNIGGKELTEAIRNDGYNGVEVTMQSGGKEYLAFDADSIISPNAGFPDAPPPDMGKFAEQLAKMQERGKQLQRQIDQAKVSPLSDAPADMAAAEARQADIIEELSGMGEIESGLKADITEYQSKPEALAAYLSKLTPELRADGTWGDQIGMVKRRVEGFEDTVANTRTTTDALANLLSGGRVDELSQTPDPGLMSKLKQFIGIKPDEVTPARTTVNQVLDRLGFETTKRGPMVTADKAADIIRGKMSRQAQDELDADLFGDFIGPQPADEILKAQRSSILNQTVPDPVADTLATLKKSLAGPDPTNLLTDGLVQYNRLWKGLQTNPWINFHVRNLGSGQAREVLAGNDPLRYSGMVRRMSNGGEVTAEEAMQFPGVAQLMKEQNIPEADATNALRQYIHKYMGGERQGIGLEDIGGKFNGITEGNNLGEEIGFLGGLSGTNPVGVKAAIKELKPIISKADRVEGWNRPAALRGIGGRENTVFVPSAAGEKLGEGAEALNRIPSWLDQIDKGVDPAQAARNINASQIDYSTRAFTPFENTIRRLGIMPFYSFSSRNIPYVAKELMNNPTGRTGTLFKGLTRLRSDDEFLPEHIAQSLAIPLGQSDEGEPRYMTGLGLMEEDLLGAVDTGDPMKAIGYELMGRLSPLIKAPIEHVLGKSLFQSGYQGPRDTEDMDPQLGRLLSNLKSIATGEDQRVAVDTRMIEPLLQTIPGIRAMSNLRQVTDKRKYDYAGAPLLLNQLTGSRVSDVSNSAQDASLMDMIANEYKGMGGRDFSNYYIPDAVKEGMTPEEFNHLLMLRMLQSKQDRDRRERQELERQKAMRGY